MKVDEKAFLIWFALEFMNRKNEARTWFQLLTERVTYKKPRDYEAIPFKRKIYLLEKWCDKGWYEYGVCVDLGWLTPKGPEKAKSLMGEADTEYSESGKGK